MFNWINSINRPRGFTLIETLIAMSIGIIGMVGGYALLANIQGTAAANRTLVDAQQEARNVVARVAREIREATSDNDDYHGVYLYPEDGSDYIYFWTPRDENRTFIVGDDGRPEWQRWIFYGLSYDSHELYRYQFQQSQYLQDLQEDPGGTDWMDAYHWEVVSSNVENIEFKRIGDMISISVRTFAERDGKVGHVAKSYADYSTMVKLRN